MHSKSSMERRYLPVTVSTMFPRSDLDPGCPRPPESAISRGPTGADSEKLVFEE